MRKKRKRKTKYTIEEHVWLHGSTGVWAFFWGVPTWGDLELELTPLLGHLAALGDLVEEHSVDRLGLGLVILQSIDDFLENGVRLQRHDVFLCVCCVPGDWSSGGRDEKKKLVKIDGSYAPRKIKCLRLERGMRSNGKTACHRRFYSREIAIQLSAGTLRCSLLHPWLFRKQCFCHSSLSLARNSPTHSGAKCCKTLI